MVRGKWLLMVGVLVFAAIGGGTFWWWRDQQARARDAKKEQKAAAGPAVFEGNEVSLQGMIFAREIVAVKPPVDGVIEELFADNGNEVAEGQLLARLSNAKNDVALEEATAEVERLKTRQTNLDGSLVAARLEASRAAAEASRARGEYEKALKIFERQQFLLREGATPRLVFEKAQKEHEQAKTESDNTAKVAEAAEDRIGAITREIDAVKKTLDEKNEDLEQAKADVAAGEVLSPVTGLVVGRQGQPGDSVNPATEGFFQIAVNLNAMELRIELNPAVLPRIKPGQKAKLRIAEEPQEVDAEVREIKEGAAILDFENANPAIRPGLTALARIKLD